MKKRVFSIVLALVMVLGLLPAAAFADAIDELSQTVGNEEPTPGTEGGTNASSDGAAAPTTSAPAAAPAAVAAEGCPICGETDGTHTAICRYSCPNGCTVTYNGAAYTHSDPDCVYNDSELYCPECGYLTYRADEEDYVHADTCKTGNPDQSEETGTDAPPRPAADRYDIDGVTYFGVQSKHFEDSTSLFIQDMLTAKNGVLGDKSTAALWQYLAFCIQDIQGRGTSTGKFKNQFDNVIPNGLAYNTNSTGTYSANKHNGDNNYNVRSSGLVHANSMSEAGANLEEQLFQWYRSSGGGRNDQYGDADDAAIRRNDTLKNDTDEDDVFWMATGAFKTSGTNKKGHYQALGVLFSDITITTILPEDEGSYKQTVQSEPTAGSTAYASDVKNMTGAQVSAQQEITNTSSATATSEINGSKSFGFEESLELGYKREMWGGEGHVNFTFTASQTIENGWSESKATTEELTTTYNVSVELPPYTNVMMKQNTSKSTVTTEYNCPVALNFTVTIVEYTLDPSSNNANCNTQVLATFGANARKDIKQRGVIEYTITDPNGVRWVDLYNSRSELRAIVRDMLAATAPMASAGAKFEVVYNSVTDEVSGLAPIFPLSVVQTANGVREYNLTTGEYLYVDGIALEGLNDRHAPYYGFTQDKGNWTLVDENGDETVDSSVAKLETNPVTGYTKLVAGQTAGTVYLKYLIDENCYATSERPDTYRENAHLDSTAVIEVNVSEVAFNAGAVLVSGTLNGITGDPAKAIEGTDGLTAKIEDATGKEVSRPVVWDARELNGIKVENNQISFTQAGTYHIRATTGGVRSGWYEVTALPARELTTITIPETADFDYKDYQTLDLTALTVQYKDQYGADWANVPALTWACEDEGTEIDENGVLTVPGAGTYTVTASGEGITSNTLTITVTDSTVKVTDMTPAESSLSASGGSVEFTITGENLTDGITIQANEAITATTTGTDTEQKATLTFPINTDTSSDVTYTVTNSLDDAFTATVTVAHQSTSSGGGGGGSIGGGGGGGGSAVTRYDLTIRYVYEDGTTAAPDHTDRLERGSSYSVASPVIDGYTADRAEVSGTMTDDLTVTVTYAADTSINEPDVPLSELPLPFTDVALGTWFREPVAYVYINNLMSGLGETTFGPDDLTSRSMIVTILHRLDEEPSVDSAADFSDVLAGSWYQNAVNWGTSVGIIGGYGDGRFGPDDSVTREQLVAILYRYAQMKGYDVSGKSDYSRFVDADAVSSYAADAMSWAVSSGLITGTSDTTLSPDGTASRAQVAMIMMRFCENFLPKTV